MKRFIFGWCALLGCGGPDDLAPMPGPDHSGPPASPYGARVVKFEPGPGAGFGQDQLPGIVLGPPAGASTGVGSLDVLSLGATGTITLDFDEIIVDGPGADFVVFENPFWVRGDETQPYAELGEVSVSDDGEHWRAFPCDQGGDGQGHYLGCAGWQPAIGYDPWAAPLAPELSGGDAFDLASLGLPSARYVRIRDLAGDPEAGPTAGFDLDAIGLTHWGSGGLR